MKEQELKRCPLCGGKVELQRKSVNYQFITGEYSLDTLWSVGCPKCKIAFSSSKIEEIEVNFWKICTTKNYEVIR